MLYRYLNDLEVTVTDFENILVLAAKRDSGELRCPATALSVEKGS